MAPRETRAEALVGEVAFALETHRTTRARARAPRAAAGEKAVRAAAATVAKHAATLAKRAAPKGQHRGPATHQFPITRERRTGATARTRAKRGKENASEAAKRKKPAGAARLCAGGPGPGAVHGGCQRAGLPQCLCHSDACCCDLRQAMRAGKRVSARRERDKLENPESNGFPVLKKPRSLCTDPGLAREDICITGSY